MKISIFIADLMKCGCKGRDWDDYTDATVRNFAGVPTRFPNAADINGIVSGNIGAFFLGDPESLRVKTVILGVQR